MQLMDLQCVLPVKIEAAPTSLALPCHSLQRQKAFAPTAERALNLRRYGTPQTVSARWRRLLSGNAEQAGRMLTRRSPRRLFDGCQLGCRQFVLDKADQLADAAWHGTRRRHRVERPARRVLVGEQADQAASVRAVHGEVPRQQCDAESAFG